MTGIKEPTTAAPHSARTQKIAKARTGRKAGDSPEAKIVTDAATRTKRQRNGNALIAGAVPRVDLLPTEVLVDRRQRAVVRRAWLGVVFVAAVTALGIGAASATALHADSDLAVVRSETDALTKARLAYSSVELLEKQTSVLQAAQEVGGSTDIDWGTYLQNLQASLPSGVSITGVSIDSASPLETYVQPTSPLQGERIATLTIDASSPTLPSVPDWLNAVKGLTGYVDANANSTTLDTSTGTYTVNMTIHINAKAFDGKYSAKGK